MVYGNENPSVMPDKKLLDTCVSAFEIAIREIRKIESGGNADNLNEPIILDKSALSAMSSGLSQYGRELYCKGFRDGRENYSRTEDTIADEIRLTISDIINKAVFSDSRKQRGGERG